MLGAAARTIRPSTPPSPLSHRLSLSNSPFAAIDILRMATTATTQSQPRERRPSTSAPLSDFKGPVGPQFTRPKHKRTVTGFGPGEIKNVEASIPEPQRAAWRKFVR